MRSVFRWILQAFGGAGAAVLSFAPPALAVTEPIADVQPGQMLGVGLSGLSWDYGWQTHALGLEIRNTSYFPAMPQDRFLLGSRGVWKLGGTSDFAVSAVGGIQLDPGVPGNRAYLIPDAGLGVSYRLKMGDITLALRFNVTLTLDQGQNQQNYPYPIYGSPDGYGVPVTGNLLQRLTTGPNTMLSIALRPDDRYEITAFGRTLLGLRFRY
jgi:hypothetical protein